MELQKILVPVDVARCSPEVFELLNRFGRSSQVTVILLHVVTLNIVAAERRIYEELSCEAKAYLERLASCYFDPEISVVFRVCRGRPAEQILAQAKADQADLIFLPVCRLSLGKGPAARISTLARKIVQGAKCDVFVVPVDSWFDCEQIWGRWPLPVEASQSESASYASTISSV